MLKTKYRYLKGWNPSTEHLPGVYILNFIRPNGWGGGKKMKINEHNGFYTLTNICRQTKKEVLPNRDIFRHLRASNPGAKNNLTRNRER